MVTVNRKRVGCSVKYGCYWFKANCLCLLTLSFWKWETGNLVVESSSLNSLDTVLYFIEFLMLCTSSSSYKYIFYLTTQKPNSPSLIHPDVTFRLSLCVSWEKKRPMNFSVLFYFTVLCNTNYFKYKATSLHTDKHQHILQNWKQYVILVTVCLNISVVFTSLSWRK